MEEKLCDLAAKQCKPCEGGVPPLSMAEVEPRLAVLPGWEHAGGVIAKQFDFKNYYQTMAFVNAVAWIAHSQGHHPDLEVSYRSCRVRYSTHAIGGLSENDFICAARVEGLLLDSKVSAQQAAPS
jgi:4a-hydroxytetrahydrobiopterin dehydratase